MTLGNYLGMLEPALEAQTGKDNIFCVVNYHAITVPQDPKDLKRRTLEVAKIYLACGLDLKHSTLFVQSAIPEHVELGWILNCFTYFGEASRQVQFKDKHSVKGENVTVGLFDYPVLMASDILIYDANEVPVGEDQKQHVELARDVAIRMNNKFGTIFTVPDVTVKKEGARIMSLTHPLEKMSKSGEDPNGYILLLDKPEDIRKKFAKAVTDSDVKVKFDPKAKPGVSNLLNIMSVCTGTPIATLEKQFENTGYGDFKSAVAEAVIAKVEPIQKRYYALSDTAVEKILAAGAKKVRPLAGAKLAVVKKAIGIIDYS